MTLQDKTAALLLIICVCAGSAHEPPVARAVLKTW
jgi:hypothetical protein